MNQKRYKPITVPSNSPKRSPAKTEYLTSVRAEPVEGALESPPKREEMGGNERESKNSSLSTRSQSALPIIAAPGRVFLRIHHVIPSAAEESQTLAPNQSRLPHPVIPVKSGILHPVTPAPRHVLLRPHHVIPSAAEESKVDASNPRSWPPPHPARHSYASNRHSRSPTRRSLEGRLLHNSVIPAKAGIQGGGAQL